MVVPRPTAAIVKLFNSLSGWYAYPAYSILTYCITPELSSSLPVGKAASPEPAKPKPISASLIPPSTEVKPVTAVPFQVSVVFTLAVPNKTTPPQSPDAGF